MQNWQTMRRAVALSVLVTVVGFGSAGCGRRVSVGAPAAPATGGENPSGGQQQPVGAGAVTGRVVDARTNNPIANAQVSAGMTSVTTSASGAFVLSNVPAGLQNITAAATGYDPGSVSITVQPNQTNDAGSISLSRGSGTGGGIGPGQGSTAPNPATTTIDITYGLLKSKWSPVAVAAFGGNVYVAATGKKDLGLINGGGVLAYSSAGKRIEEDLMSTSIRGVAAASDGTIFAVDDKYVYSGKLTKGFLGIGQSLKFNKKNAGLSGATDITADGVGSVYVAAGGGISKFPFDLSTISSLTGTNQGGAAFTATSGVGADSQGNLFFVSGSKVEKVNVKGDPVWTIDGANSADPNARLSAPIDVAVDNVNQYIYVLDGSSIKRFDANGGFLVSFGNGFSRPTSIACDESGNVYVADAGASKVFVFGAAPRQ